jgi:transposase InsO family protein
LSEAGIEPSVGSVGDSYDNALVETTNGLFDAEVIHRRRPWQSFEAVEYAMLYNTLPSRGQRCIEFPAGHRSRSMDKEGSVPNTSQAALLLYILER